MLIKVWNLPTTPSQRDNPRYFRKHICTAVAALEEPNVFGNKTPVVLFPSVLMEPDRQDIEIVVEISGLPMFPPGYGAAAGTTKRKLAERVGHFIQTHFRESHVLCTIAPPEPEVVGWSNET